MENKTKRSPGRPKAAQSKEVAATVSTGRKIKHVEKKVQNKEYELIRGGGVVFLMPQSGITVYDESKNTVRELRYCPNEPSIWRDEQSENAVKQAITFDMKRLFVPKSKPNLIEFMEVHPGNAANGGTLFKEINKKLDAEKALEKEFSVTEAVGLVRDSDISTLLPIAMYFKVNTSKPVSEIRYDLLQIAKSKPTEFIGSFDSPQVQTRASIQQAKDYQIIRVKEDGVYWFDSNSLIVSVPVGKDPVDVAVRFCMTERGASVISDIEDRLDKLS